MDFQAFSPISWRFVAIPVRLISAAARADTPLMRMDQPRHRALVHHLPTHQTVAASTHGGFWNERKRKQTSTTVLGYSERSGSSWLFFPAFSPHHRRRRNSRNAHRPQIFYSRTRSGELAVHSSERETAGSRQQLSVTSSLSRVRRPETQDVQQMSSVD